MQSNLEQSVVIIENFKAKFETDFTIIPKFLACPRRAIDDLIKFNF